MHASACIRLAQGPAQAAAADALTVLSRKKIVGLRKIIPHEDCLIGYGKMDARLKRLPYPGHSIVLTISIDNLADNTTANLRQRISPSSSRA